MVSLNLVNMVMFAALSLLCGAVFLGLRRQSSLAWLAVSLLIGSLEIMVLGADLDASVIIAAATIMVPAAYLAFGQSVRLTSGGPFVAWPFVAVGALAALSLLMLGAGVPFPLQSVAFHLACAVALAESIIRLWSSRRGIWDLLLITVLLGVVATFLVRIPLYPLLFGIDASFATVRASGIEKTLLMASAALTPPAVFLLLARVIGSVIATHRSRAERDGLTGLYNRRALDEMAIVPDPAGGAVVFCDIDHFKRVNDRYGHQTGDAVIRAFATLIEHTGYRAARIGGEEFVLLLPGKSAAAAAEIAEMVRLRFIDTAHPNIAGENRPTASFGVAEYAPGQPPVTAFAHADGALYGAKQAGRNLVVSLGQREPAQGAEERAAA